MKYQEQVGYLDRSMSMLANGKSREEIDDFLMREGLDKWDLKKINQLVDRRLKDKYKLKVKSYMLQGILEAKIPEFNELDADAFEQIQYEIIGELRAESQRKIRELFSQGYSDEDIIEMVESDFVNEEDILNEIVLESEKQEEEKEGKSKAYGYIFLGVFLSLGGYLMDAGTIVIFYGLVLYGLFLLFKQK